MKPYRFLPTMTCTVSLLGMLVFSTTSSVASNPSEISMVPSAFAAGRNAAAWSGCTWRATANHPSCPIFGLPVIVYTIANGPPGGFQSIHFQPAISKVAVMYERKMTASGSPGITAASNRVPANGFSRSASAGSVTASHPIATRAARKNVAGNVPRLILLATEASLSFMPCFLSRSAKPRGNRNAPPYRRSVPQSVCQ
jgi:hypothetical protein